MFRVCKKPRKLNPSNKCPIKKTKTKTKKTFGTKYNVLKNGWEVILKVFKIPLFIMQMQIKTIFESTPIRMVITIILTIAANKF